VIALARKLKKVCQRCHDRAPEPGYRFCEYCLGEVRKAMEQSGYLTEVPRPGRDTRAWRLTESEITDLLGDGRG
jgi:predicted amidophosphoribosyltransferase